MPNSPYSSIDVALEELRQGRMVILTDDEDRENEGDLILAAEKTTPEAITFMAKQASGLICLSMTSERVEALGLPMMVQQNASKLQTPFTISIEAKDTVGSGISAADRANTILTAIDEQSGADGLVSPGHIFPLRAKDGGVLVRNGHTEGGVDLARLAGLKPAAVLCEIMDDDGTMSRGVRLQRFATKHGLCMISIADLIAYRMQHEQLVDESSSARLPTGSHSDFTMKVFTSAIDQAQHVAMVHGELDVDKPVLVRLHSECLTGDIFGSVRCDCGMQLQTALDKIGNENGVLIYMRQEGRGIGLANKIKAYDLQDDGLDTVEANHKLGFLADERDYGIAAQILQRLGCTKIRLLTNNPAKISGLERYGIEIVARESLELPPTKDNIHYLRTKKDKMGHLLTLAA